MTENLAQCEQAKLIQKYTLKELRARKNKTQEEVAKDMGVSCQTYNAWEKDISNVGVRKVYALAEYYGVTLDEIKLTRE